MTEAKQRVLCLADLVSFAKQTFSRKKNNFKKLSQSGGRYKETQLSTAVQAGYHSEQVH